jgi:NAD(P)H-hydrate epimerase
MENAGRAVAEQTIKIAGHRGKVAVFCGKGNNGGDGFVAARHLMAKGIKPDVFLAGNMTEVKNEAKINLEILLKIKQKITEVREKNMHLVENKISKYDIIIDALLGVGLKGEVKGVIKRIIELINEAGASVLSVDIPSGLDATTGKALGICVKADKTVTFIARKHGMVLGKASGYCGEIIVEDLGIPLCLFDRKAFSF